MNKEKSYSYVLDSFVFILILRTIQQAQPRNITTQCIATFRETS